MQKKILKIIADNTPEEAVKKISALIKENDSVDWEKLKKLFIEETGKSIRVVSPKVKASIKARLREGYTKGDIANTIKNAVKDEYHKENNFYYVTLAYISRSDIIDRYSVLRNDNDKIKLGLKTD